MPHIDHPVPADGAADRLEPARDEHETIISDRSSYVNAVLFGRKSTRAERARATRKPRAPHEPERI